MDKRIRESIRMIEREGFVILRVTDQGNQHKRIYVEAAGDPFITIPTSPGNDATGAANIVRGKCRALKRQLAVEGK